jgi:RNA polymerase sigma factor (TIGR02999 family)
MLSEKIAQLIQSAERGDTAASEELFTILYDELHRLARRQLGRGALSISPTTLLHETYLNLSGRPDDTFPDRARFLAYASRTMRSLLVDYVRRRDAQKRGGFFEITSLPTEIPSADEVDATQLEGIGEALDTLGAVEPRLAQIVDLRFFCGFSFAESAELLGISERTAQRDWDKARILLQRYLG